MDNLNPILVLAAAAHRSGNRYFAGDLLLASRGARDCKAIRKSSSKLAGLPDISIALVVEARMIAEVLK